MPALLTASAVSFSHDGSAVDLITDLSFHVAPGDRIAVVGDNGVGKTTLLELVAGHLEPVRGSITRAPDLTLGNDATRSPDELQRATDVVVAADPRLVDALLDLRIAERRQEREPDDASAALALASAIAAWTTLDGWSAEARASALLDHVGLAHDRRDAPLGELSGGEHARVGIASALATPADLLVLDEPTEHLDAAGIEWLARELRTSGRALVFTSHDRWFVNEVSNAALVLERGGATLERGSFDDVEHRMRDARDRQERAWANDQRRRASLERAAAARMSTARSMLVDPATGKGTTHFHYRKRAAKVERTAKVLRRRVESTPALERPFVERDAASIVVDPARRGADVLVRLRGVEVGWEPGAPVLDGVDLEVARGDHVVLVGPNGSGKSTLVAIATGVLEPWSGVSRVPSTADVALVSQVDDELDEHGGVVAACTGPGATRGRRRRALELLAALRVRERLLDCTIGELSAGTRRKVALVRALLSDAPLLVLDEPTNHLDLAARDSLAAALGTHPAAWIVVSHDRSFVDALGGRHVDVGRWRVGGPGPDVG